MGFFMDIMKDVLKPHSRLRRVVVKVFRQDYWDAGLSVEVLQISGRDDIRPAIPGCGDLEGILKVAHPHLQGSLCIRGGNIRDFDPGKNIPDEFPGLVMIQLALDDVKGVG